MFWLRIKLFKVNFPKKCFFKSYLSLEVPCEREAPYWAGMFIGPLPLSVWIPLGFLNLNSLPGVLKNHQNSCAGRGSSSGTCVSRTFDDVRFSSDEMPTPIFAGRSAEVSADSQVGCGGEVTLDRRHRHLAPSTSSATAAVTASSVVTRRLDLHNPPTTSSSSPSITPLVEGGGQNVTLEPAVLIGGENIHVGQIIDANLSDEDMYHNFGSTIARVMDLSSLWWENWINAKSYWVVPASNHLLDGQFLSNLFVYLFNKKTKLQECHSSSTLGQCSQYSIYGYRRHHQRENLRDI